MALPLKPLTTRTSKRDLYFGPLSERRIAAFHIKKKRRNLFLTVTDLTGAVLRSVSAKLFAADRKKRQAPHIIELAARQLTLTLKAYRVSAVRLFTKVSRKYIGLSIARTLRLHNIYVTFAADLVAVAHNGCRKKKSRRL